MRKNIFSWMGILIFLLGVMPALAQDRTMHLRVAHFSPDAPAVDVYVDGEVAVQGLEYPNITGWVELEAGDYTIAIAPAGTSLDDAVIGPRIYNLVRDTWVTVAAVGSADSGTLASNVLIENFEPMYQEGYARLSVTHAIDGAPPINVLADGIAVVTSLAYPGTQGANDGFYIRPVDLGTFELEVTLSEDDSVILTVPDVEFEAGMNYLVAAIGTPDDPDLSITVTSLTGEMMGGMEMTVTAMSADDTSDEDMTDADTTDADTTDEDMTDADMTDTEKKPLIIADLIAGASEAEQNPELTVFSAMLSVADPAILGVLSNPDLHLTVFAPTDAAFATLMDAMDMDAATMLGDTDALNAVLMYHVVDGIMTSDTLATMDGQSIPTMLGNDSTIAISNTDEVTLNGTAHLMITDVQADNGVLHVIDAVLLPFEMVEEPVAEMTEEPMPEMTEEPMPEMTEEATAEAQVIEVTEEPTVEPTAVPTIEPTIEPTAEPEVEVTDEAQPEETEEPEVEATDEAQPEATEEAMSNTVVDVMVASTKSDEPEFTILLSALNAADPSILEALSDPTVQWTVFAPTDEAFEAFMASLEIDAETLLADTDTLNTILSYHVVVGTLMAEDIQDMDRETIETQLGEGALISIRAAENGAITLNDTVTVTMPDIEADNGVIHALDGVLEPEIEG